MAAVGQRIIAAVAKRRVETEPLGFANDVSLGHVLKRGMDGEDLAFDAGLCREIRQALEFLDEPGPAIRIAGIIESIHADEDVQRTACLRKPKGEAEEDRVARRDIGHRKDRKSTRL